MQRKKNDVKARTTLLLSLSDEHQLQVIVSQLQFMDVEVEKDDLNQKFLTSLAPEWLMHTIVWRNRNDLDTMSLDDLYNHLKVYKAEVQKKSNSNSQDMAFISSLKNINNEDGNYACVTTANKELEELKLEKDGLDGKLAGLLKASKNLDYLIESHRSDQVKEGVGYNDVPPPAADLYLSPKKDLSWTGLPEFVDDTVTDYSRPSPTVASTSAEGEGSKGRQLGLKIIHIRDLHSDVLVTDHMGAL
nr:ribonuclease H-like domain-containing protein [Tanacetum cinerariifolium]